MVVSSHDLYLFHIHKLTPVTVKIQEKALAELRIERALYLTKLAGTGPPIEE